MIKLLKIKKPKNIFVVNLLFVFVFLNAWDLAISHKIFNSMAIGVFLFSAPAVLWLVSKRWSIALLTLISFVQFVMILVLLLQGIEVSGFGITSKTIFFMPFLLMNVLNMVWGLKFYYGKVGVKTR